VRSQRRIRTLFAVSGWVQNIGVILLLFAAWQFWGTSIEQGRAQQSLRQQFDAEVQKATPGPSGAAGATLIPVTTRLPEPPEGSVVAHLEIPAIGVDQYVVEGTAESDLAKGPGHYIGTPMPGQAGNVAIAGHRTTYGAPFNHLDALRPGDGITLTTSSDERLHYVVIQMPAAVSPQDVSVLNSFSDDRLTLTTCNPKFSASQRLVVVALLQEPQSASPAPAPATTVKPRAVHVVAGNVGWNTGFLPLTSLVTLLLVLLGLANRRAKQIYGRVGRWLVLTPIWTVGLIVLFTLLTKLVPATL